MITNFNLSSNKETKVNNPLENKRATYLKAFQWGTDDYMLKGEIDQKGKSSAYYRKGYNYGRDLHHKLFGFYRKNEQTPKLSDTY